MYIMYKCTLVVWKEKHLCIPLTEIKEYIVLCYNVNLANSYWFNFISFTSLTQTLLCLFSLLHYSNKPYAEYDNNSTTFIKDPAFK